jgi:protein-tyrosine phosphatase
LTAVYTCDAIVDGRLYQGPSPKTQEDWNDVFALGVDTVVDLQTEEEEGPGIATPSGVHGRFLLVWLPIRDAAPAPDLEWMETASRVASILYHRKRRILTHCMMGVSRSTFFNALLLMRCYGLTRDAALRIIKERRPCADPIPAFVDALGVFEDALFGGRS